MPRARANTSRAKALKATTPVEFATALDISPKKVRAALRRRGIYVSKGTPFKAAAIIDAFAPKA